MTCRARSRSRVPPASIRARGRDLLVTASNAVEVQPAGWLRPAAMSQTVAGASPAAAAIER
jgi:hypothetical protein